MAAARGPPSFAPRPASPPATTARCRCGKRFENGGHGAELARPSELLRRYLGDQRFCSPACLRAFLLEALERLDAEVTPWVVSDADRLAGEIRGILARGEVERLQERFGAGAARYPGQRPQR